MKVSFRPDIILCGWLGLKHQLTKQNFLPLLLVITARRSKLVGGMCSVLPYMALVFAVMHLYNIFKFFIASVHSFFLYILFFYNLVLINRRNGPRYQRVLSLCVFFFFFNRGDTEGTNSSKILCSIFVHVLLYVNLCTWLILWFLNNLWFDDLRAE